MSPVIGVTRHATPEECKAEADRIWVEHWVEQLTRNGDVDLELVKDALAGYWNLQCVVEIVWDEATGGRMSKSNYNDTGQILGCIQEAQDEAVKDQILEVLCDINEGITDRFGGLRENGAGMNVLEVVTDRLFEEFDITMDELTDAAKRREWIKHEIEKRVEREGGESS